MKRKRPVLVLWSLPIALLALQFFRPTPAPVEAAPPDADFIEHYAVPAPFRDQLRESCYDCHSNQTVYPWYAKIQPVGWIVRRHIDEGRSHLNFSRFAHYSADSQADHLDEILDELVFRTMPLKSYALLHPEAKLADADREALINWLQALRDKMDD